MKKLLVIALAMLSLTAFAKGNASKEEKQFFCRSIDKAMQAEAAESAIDMEKCLKARIKSKLASEGIRLLKGRIKFYSVGKSFYQNCELSYEAEPKEQNILNGLDGVNCQ